MWSQEFYGCKLEIPVRDPPLTPATPDLPSEAIAIFRSNDNLDKQSANSSSNLDRTAHTGRWEKLNVHHFKKIKKLAVFKPASCEDAKFFLSKYALMNSSSTPKHKELFSRIPQPKGDGSSEAEDFESLNSKSSRSKNLEFGMICHGCHGPLGNGAHAGSLPGKNQCIFVHSDTCAGGIKEDDSFRACPDGYKLVTQGSSNAEDGKKLGNNMQQNIEQHRAENQIQNENKDKPSDFEVTIADLRKDPARQKLVEEQISVLRSLIPALFPHQNATSGSVSVSSTSTGSTTTVTSSKGNSSTCFTSTNVTNSNRDPMASEVVNKDRHGLSNIPGNFRPQHNPNFRNGYGYGSEMYQQCFIPVDAVPRDSFQHRYQESMHHPRMAGHPAASYTKEFFPISPVYDYFQDSAGKVFKVPRKQEQTPQTRKEFRCSPLTGEVYTVDVPIHQHHERTPVLPSVNKQQPYFSAPSRMYNDDETGDFEKEIQNKVSGIVQLCNSGKKNNIKSLDFAKQASAKWAKKTTIESVNLPLFIYGAVSELESSMSGKTEPISSAEFLSKLRHIKNILDVCCLNSDSTDFKGYGWTIAKDYAIKVENNVEHQLKSWDFVPEGIQTGQLVLAQMDYPKPPVKQKEKVNEATKKKCSTYNTCKTEDKCDFELENPDKKCIYKHECNWCKEKYKQSWKHQEWNCKKKSG